MGAPVQGMNPAPDPAEDASVEAFTTSLRTISAPERRKHASVYNYWLSIRGGRDFPPIHDLDPLEISDVGAFSVLLEIIGGGEDAEIRHLGQAIGAGIEAAKISDAPSPSFLSCIATRLPVVAACRDAFAFEEEFEGAGGKTRCWVTLLPFSASGTWIDFVYAFVSLDPLPEATQPAPGANAEVETSGDLSELLKLADSLANADASPEEEIGAEVAQAQPAEEQLEEQVETSLEPPRAEELAEAVPAAEPHHPSPEGPAIKPSFSERFFETLANVGGFYGRAEKIELDPATASFESWEAHEPVAQEEPIATEKVAPPSLDETSLEAAFADEPSSPEEPVQTDEPYLGQADSQPDEPEIESIPTAEVTLHSKLTDVRAKADEARQAKLRANSALYEGLSAAYDFALDAEDSPEEYLKLVQGEGLKIQLRSPMKPVAKLAFEGMCDEMTIKQLEAILAWAFDQELPRGSLAARIEEAGGIGPILNGRAEAA
jgi:hypothetical protein